MICVLFYNYLILIINKLGSWKEQKKRRKQDVRKNGGEKKRV